MSGRAELHDALAEGALWRALALALGPPTPELAAELRALAAPLPGATRAAFERLAALAHPDLDARHHVLLGAGGACPPAESDHRLAGTIGGKGGLLGDVCGFYEAFHYDARADFAEAPDHVAVELGFLAWLCLKEAYAVDAGLADEAALCREARYKFREEHLASWLPGFCARLEDLAGEGFYAAGARTLRELAVTAASAP